MLQSHSSPRTSFLERLPDGLTSIGDDPRILLAFKHHAGLPTFEAWTEADFLLKSHLSAAERHVDEISGVPYRIRSFRYAMDWIPRCGRFYRFGLPRYPVNSGITIGWTADNLSTGTYVQDTDFKLYGATTLSPEIIFGSLSFQLPTTIQTPYPYIVSFTAGPGQMAEIALITMFELAAYYYRCPEAVNDKNPNAGSVYQSHLDLLANSFL